MNKLRSFCFVFGMLIFIPLNAEVLPNASKKPDEYYMQRAIELARHHPKAPFAALIVDNTTGEILATGLNDSERDPTFHGEMVAIHNLVKKYPNVNWANVTLYTTAEPCPMCQSAIIWSNISRVVFATSIDYLSKHGWNQILLMSSEVNHHAEFYKGTIKGGVLAPLADPLFDKHKEVVGA